MKIINKIKEMSQYSEECRRKGNTIAFVPTMGFLHEGHLSLVKRAIKLCDKVVVSIFVNPTQFAPTEDLDTYPRDFGRDSELLKKEGVDILFAPEAKALYPDNYRTYINVTEISEHLCGISRPAFFKGVATIVTKLFNIIKPHKAVFGTKDFQQFVIVRQMVRDLNLDIDIVGSPIVRESDGLAMSSRNNYLKPEQRKAALSLFQALKNAVKKVENGEKKAESIIKEATASINFFDSTTIDYILICDPDTFEDIAIIERPALMALAVKVGKTRLIDNMMLGIGEGKSKYTRKI